MTQPLNPPAKDLPREITSYDLLKSAAVIIMIIDHIGAYFFPDFLWWRAIGRIGFPVWFFLVGYSSGRGIPDRLWICAAILLVANLITGMPIFPMNALVTIMALRVTIDPVMKVALRNEWALWTVGALLFILIIPSSYLVEYGTQALITAMFGYMVRHKKTIGNDGMVVRYMAFALISFVLMQRLAYDFSIAQFTFMAFGTFIVRGTLYFFEARTFPDLTKVLPKSASWLLQFGGRRTLEIYVVHLLLFKIVTAWYGVEGHGFFKAPLFF